MLRGAIHTKFFFKFEMKKHGWPATRERKSRGYNKLKQGSNRAKSLIREKVFVLKDM